MIDEVVICGVRRARELVDIEEIKQAIGRAGRSYTKPGKAVILCPSQDCDYADKCLNDETPPVRSELSTVKEVAFHVLPWIDRVYDEESFQKWYSRSLASTQGVVLHWVDVSKYLLETGCIDEEYNVTEFGKISVRMYYPPARLCKMREKLLESEANGNTTELFTLSYIFADEHIPLSNVEAWELSEYKSSVYGEGYSFSNGELMHGFAYYCAMAGGIVPKWIRHVVSQIRDDLPRLFNALVMVAESEGLNSLANDLIIASISAIRKVPMNIAGIMNTFSLKRKSSAMELHNMGIETKEDLKENEGDVMNYGSELLKKDLQESGFLKGYDHMKLMNGSRGDLKNQDDDAY